MVCDDNPRKVRHGAAYPSEANEPNGFRSSDVGISTIISYRRRSVPQYARIDIYFI